MVNDDDKPDLPASQSGVDQVGKEPMIPQPPAKPETGPVLDPGQQAKRAEHEHHRRHRARAIRSQTVRLLNPPDGAQPIDPEALIKALDETDEE